MYYEARSHELVPVQDAREAAIKIQSGELSGYQVPVWVSGTIKMLAVSDHHHSEMSSFYEVALLMQEGEDFYQVESISAKRIPLDELVDTFEENTVRPFTKGKTTLLVGKPKGDEVAWFECSCCGEGFKGNIKQQQEFDQDAGYGMCDSCCKGW